MPRHLAVPIVLLFVLGAGCSAPPAALDIPSPTVPPTGVVKDYALTAQNVRWELKPGVVTEAFAYNGQVPGPEIRLRLGDRVRVTLKNELDEPTTIHWHGIRVPAGMDGVPGVSQEPVPPGGTFVYEFVPPDAGTYFYHSHVAVDEQVDRGLYGAFIVEPPSGAAPDAVFALDDWLVGADGVRLPTSASTQETALDNALDSVSAALAAASEADGGHAMDSGHAMHGSMMGGTGMMEHMIAPDLNGRFGNLLTVNGKNAPAEAKIGIGEKRRVRLINASNAMTHELRASDGRELDIVAADGGDLAVPIRTASLKLPPAKRFDLLVEGDGTSWALEGRRPGLHEPLRIAFVPSSEPVPGTAAVQGAFVAAPPDLAHRRPDTEFVITTGTMMGASQWMLNGRAYDMHGENPLAATFKEGTWAKIRFTNRSPMAHTMHAHGQFLWLIARNGQVVPGAQREDTVVVRPMETVDVAYPADNIGDWVLHCHNLEHEEHGLMARFRVE